MSLTVEKKPRHSAHRTTSSDELNKKKAKSKTRETATVHFNAIESHRNSVELTLKKVSPISSRKAPKESAESSTSSNYSQEQSEPRVRPEALQVVRTLSDQEYERAEAFRNYDEARRIHDSLANKVLKGEPLTTNEHAKLQQAALDVHFLAYQFHFVMGIPVDRNPYGLPFCAPDEGINFFSPDLKRAHRDYNFKPLNDYLNKRIGLLKGQKHVENNAAKIAHFEKLKKTAQKAFFEQWKPMYYSDDRTIDLTEEYNGYLKTHQKQLGYLFSFERRVRFLVLALNEEINTLKNSRLKKCKEEISDLCATSPGGLAKKVSQEIDNYYRTRHLQPLLVEKGRAIIACYQHYNPADEVLQAAKAAEAWSVAFSSVKMKDQKVDWTRAIDGGRVWFLDKEGNVLLQPFELPERQEDYLAYLDRYVLNCQTVLGESLRQDGPLMQQMCDFIDEEAINEGAKVVSKSRLDAQKRIMDFLSVIMEDTPRYKPFVIKLAAKLNEWNHKRGEQQGEDVDAAQVEQMIDILMKLYRAPYQTLVTGPTTHLIRAFQHIFPDLKADHVIKGLNGDKYVSNRIEIQFMPYSVDIVYSTPSLICADGTDATMVLTQKMSLKTSRGGEKLADPVAVEFLYETPKGLSEDDKVLLQKSMDKINFTLNSIDYASMKEHKRVKPKKD